MAHWKFQNHWKKLKMAHLAKSSSQSLQLSIFFMPPAWKVRRGHLVFESSVFLSVRLSVRNFVLYKVQYLKFGWSYSNQTWTVSSWKGCSHFTDIPCPWGGMGSKCRTWEIFAILSFWLCSARGIRVSQTHVLYIKIKRKSLLGTGSSNYTSFLPQYYDFALSIQGTRPNFMLT